VFSLSLSLFLSFFLSWSNSSVSLQPMARTFTFVIFNTINPLPKVRVRPWLIFPLWSLMVLRDGWFSVPYNTLSSLPLSLFDSLFYPTTVPFTVAVAMKVLSCELCKSVPVQIVGHRCSNMWDDGINFENFICNNNDICQVETSLIFLQCCTFIARKLITSCWRFF